MSRFDRSALLEYRRRRFRQAPEYRLCDEPEAAAFINEMGICLFQPNRGVDLPSLWGAVAGREGPAPRWGEHDYLYEVAWGWKDRLFARGGFYYGKALGNYRLFLSKRLLTHLWALSEMNYGGDPDDYLELYQDGKMSLDARNVYEVLRRRGPSSTTVLRRETGLVGEAKDWARFERALAELQRGLLVAVVGVAHDNAWKYTFRYATLDQTFPAEVRAARDISGRTALAEVLAHYVGLLGIASAREAARLFRWSEDRCLRAARALLAEGRLAGGGESPNALLVAPELERLLRTA